MTYQEIKTETYKMLNNESTDNKNMYTEKIFRDTNSLNDAAGLLEDIINELDCSFGEDDYGDYPNVNVNDLHDVYINLI